MQEAYEKDTKKLHAGQFGVACRILEIKKNEKIKCKMYEGEKSENYEDEAAGLSGGGGEQL